MSSIDFNPTILQMAAAPALSSDGVSLLPLLKQTGDITRGALFWHYPHYSNQGGKPGAAIRQGDLKLIEFYEDNHFELYDLEKDIAEANNLAPTWPEKVAELLTC